MAIKIITLDLDGTLMSTDHLTVSEDNKKALAAAHEKGVKIAVATGRTLAIMGDVCEQVSEVDYIIHSNGARVIDRKTGKVIYKDPMPWSLSEGIIDYLNTMPCFYEVYIDGKSYVQEDKGDYFISDLLPEVFVNALMQRMDICKDVKATVFGKEIEKITLYSNNHEAANEMREHFSKMSDVLSIECSLPGSDSMEMTKAGVNKGAALSGMCDALGIKPEEIMAVGDAGNDISMITYAGCGVAMGNASPECKQSADYITCSNAEDGVARAVEKFVLNS